MILRTKFTTASRNCRTKFKIMNINLKISKWSSGLTIQKSILNAQREIVLKFIPEQYTNITKKVDQVAKAVTKNISMNLSFSTDVRISHVIATTTSVEFVLLRNLILQSCKNPYRGDTCLAASFKGYPLILKVGLVRVNIWQNTKSLFLRENVSSWGSSSITRNMFKGMSAKPQLITFKSASIV